MTLADMNGTGADSFVEASGSQLISGKQAKVAFSTATQVDTIVHTLSFQLYGAGDRELQIQYDTKKEKMRCQNLAFNRGKQQQPDSSGPY